MSFVTRSLRPFLIMCLCVWTALVVAAITYSRQHPADHWILLAALPSFLLEGFFYLGATIERARTLIFGTGSPLRRATVLFSSALLPYVLFSVLAQSFDGRRFSLLVGLTAVLCFWPVSMPRRLSYDFGFLVIAAAPIVARVFARIYVSPDPHLHIEDTLGHVVWLRTGIVALLVLREWDPGEFGLWPAVREWKLGFGYFLLGILPICGLALALHDVRFAPLQRTPLEVAGIAVGTFFGILWVVALSEELLFRGVIARALLNRQWSPALAVGIAAVLFGFAHLWYHEFPNWRRALVATVLGIVCGTAYVRTKSVRTPMVLHSLVVVTWRVLFK